MRGLPIFFALLTVAAGRASAQISPELHGDWVPAKSTCDAAQRLRVGDSSMVLINGKDTVSYGNIGVPTTFFGPDYSGISVVAMPEIDSGNSPFTVYFNADEKKGVTRVEIYQETKGPQNAQLKTIQAANKKLAARFPELNLKPLKHCAVQ